MVSKLTNVWAEEYKITIANLFELAGFNVETNQITGEVTISPDEKYCNNSQLQMDILTNLESFNFFE